MKCECYLQFFFLSKNYVQKVAFSFAILINNLVAFLFQQHGSSGSCSAMRSDSPVYANLEELKLGPNFDQPPSPITAPLMSSDGWEMHHDEMSGRAFYHNVHTHERSWKPPRKGRVSSPDRIHLLLYSRFCLLYFTRLLTPISPFHSTNSSLPLLTLALLVIPSSTRNTLLYYYQPPLDLVRNGTYRLGPVWPSVRSHISDMLDRYCFNLAQRQYMMVYICALFTFTIRSKMADWQFQLKNPMLNTFPTIFRTCLVRFLFINFFPSLAQALYMMPYMCTSLYFVRSDQRWPTGRLAAILIVNPPQD